MPFFVLEVSARKPGQLGCVCVCVCACVCVHSRVPTCAYVCSFFPKSHFHRHLCCPPSWPANEVLFVHLVGWFLNEEKEMTRRRRIFPKSVAPLEKD